MQLIFSTYLIGGSSPYFMLMLFCMSGRGGTDSRAATVSGTLTPVAAAVAASSAAPGRASAAALGRATGADIGGMPHTRSRCTGTRRRSATRATGPNSCLATRNSNSECEKWIARSETC